MAGILDFQRNVNFGPMQPIEASTPMLPKQGGGMFGWFNDDPGAMDAAGYSGRAPLTGQQKQSLLFSGISDAFDNLQGRDGNLTQQMSNQYAQDYTKQNAERRKSAVNKAIADAYATGDMNQVRQALMSANPEDVAHITAALNFGQPKYQEIGAGGLAELPGPMGGLPKQVVAPQAKPPQSRTIQRGDQVVTQEASPDGVWRDIPGATGPKFAPRAAKEPAPTIGAQNPAALYRRGR